MYYKEGDWESVLFPCLSVRLAIVYFFLLFHISDADNPNKNRTVTEIAFADPCSRSFAK